MSKVIIEDGTGTGNQVKVTPDRELLTRSVSSSVAAKAGQSGEDAVMGTPIYLLPTIATAATACKMLYIRNDSTIPFVFFLNLNGWNGGDTNHDRIMYADFFLETGTVLGQNILSAAFSLNQTETSTTPLTVQIWDGVTGTGMTFTNGALFSSTSLNDKGTTVIPGGDTLVLGKGDAVSIALRGGEVGKGTFSTFGYFLTEKLK